MELYNYQKHTVNKTLEYFKYSSIQFPKFNIFFEMGLGKTITTIFILKELINSNTKGMKILIICPKSLIGMWEYELSINLDTNWCLVNNIKAMNKPMNKPMSTIYITNYEQFLSIKLSQKETINIDICIFDEVHKIKNCKSKTHKIINTYVKPQYTICLTGTPITKNLIDLFGILTCVGTQLFHNLTYTEFYYKYIINGGSRSTAELIELISPFTVFANLVDHIDMPNSEDRIIPIQLTNDQYTNLDAIYTHTNNLKALERIILCQRITSGLMEGLKPFGTKLIVCEELIKSIIEDDEKVVLFCKYDTEFNYFTKKYKDICVGINGKTKDRTDAVYEFQNNDKIKVFIGNIQTAGVGITLTEANHCIFYSETYNWGDYEQSKARIYRIGQKKPCIYYHLLGIDSIDEMIHENLINKTDLISDFKNRYGGI